MKYTVVIPSIYQPYTDKCLSTIKLPKDNILVVDNTVTNKGVAASWNLGIDKMRADDTDWLIIVSAAMRFGEAGCQDMIDQLAITNSLIVECELGHNWHLIAIKREVIENVGKFDENFYPAYWEDTDYSYRVNLAYPGIHGSRWTKIFVDVVNTGWTHGVTFAKVVVDSAKLQNYLIRKWGGLQHEFKFKIPFNDPNKTIKDWTKE